MDPFHTLHRRRRLREKLKTAFGVTLTVIVCALLITVGLLRADVIDLPGSAGGSGTAAESTGEPPAPSSPFEGTPAAGFGEFDALVFPTAKATKRFGKDFVADALADVRAMLKAGRVDWPSKPQEPAEFAERFAPSLRDEITELLGGPERLAYVSALAEGRSLVAAPRVSGTISVKETVDANTVRILAISTNLVWAYPFDGPVLSTGDNLLVLNTQQRWEFALPGEIRDEDAGLWPGRLDYFAQNVECGHFREGRLSAFRFDPAQSGNGSAHEIDPDAVYDPGLDLSKAPDDCH